MQVHRARIAESGTASASTIASPRSINRSLCYQINSCSHIVRTNRSHITGGGVAVCQRRAASAARRPRTATRRRRRLVYLRRSTTTTTSTTMMMMMTLFSISFRDVCILIVCCCRTKVRGAAERAAERVCSTGDARQPTHTSPPLVLCFVVVDSLFARTRQILSHNA